MISLAESGTRSGHARWLCVLVVQTIVVLAGHAGSSGNALAQPVSADMVLPERQTSGAPSAPVPTAPAAFEFGTYISYLSAEDFGSDTLYGTRLAYHLHSGLFAEFGYASTDPDDTSYERFSGSLPRPATSQPRNEYYAASLGYELPPGEVMIGGGRSFNGAFYLLAGAGTVRFGAEEYFALSYGAGYRILTMQQIALRLDVRNFMLDAGLRGEERNVEFNLGATWFF